MRDARRNDGALQCVRSYLHRKRPLSVSVKPIPLFPTYFLPLPPRCPGTGSLPARVTKTGFAPLGT